MDDPDVELSVDYDNNLVCLYFLKDIATERIKSAFVQMRLEVPTLPGFDTLFDFSNIATPVSLDDLGEITGGWAEVAKGRDVGRRTAIVSHNPMLADRIEQVQKAVPFRTLALFADRATAVAWIHAISSNGDDSFQLI